MQIKIIIEAMMHWRKGMGHHVYATRITRTRDGASILLGIPAANVRVALQGTVTRGEIYQIDQEISGAEYRALETEGISGDNLRAFVVG